MAMVRFREFRVYTGEREGRGLFVYARVFATKREMLRAVNAEGAVMGLARVGRRTEGCMQSFKKTVYDERGKARTSACIGRVNLFKRRLGTEVIIHEFAHAMFAWADRKKLLNQLDMRGENLVAEEQLCYVLGRMARRFVDRAWKLGLYA